MLKNIFGNIRFRLYGALLLLGLCPTLYTTLRIFFLGQLPDPWAYSIAGQIGWVNLLYEVMNEGILLPLFYFLGGTEENRAEFANRLRSGLWVVTWIYGVFSLTLMVFARPLLGWMAATADIVDASISYIRIESVAALFGMLSSFTLVALVTLNRTQYLYLLTVARLIFSLLFDCVLVSQLPFSLRLGINGIGYSNLLVNLLLFLISLKMLSREGIHLFTRDTISFSWMRVFFRVGGLSALESFVRNISYMVIIVRMVNVVQAQGTYWVANNFIWGWLLLPVTQLGELIKQDFSTDRRALQPHTRGYFVLTGIICAVWMVSIPLWKPFMQYILGYSDVEALFQLVLLLLGFYVLYAFQSVFDATFYALGKTNYMLWESVVTNTVYYGGAFVFFQLGIWTPSLTGIALLFGFGMAFDSLVSLLAYRHMLKKEQIIFHSVK